jgi:hypothetical protein
MALGFDGSATLPTTGNGLRFSASASATSQTFSGSVSSAAETLLATVKGIVSINGGGTFTPQYTLSAAPGGAYSTMANSYFLIYPIGASGANTSVGAWA